MGLYDEAQEHASGWVALHELSLLERLRWLLPPWMPGSLRRMRPVGPPEGGWPPHPLRGEPDASVAAWWLEQVGWDRPGVGMFVPPGFEAYGVVLHPFWTEDERTTWTRVAAAWDLEDRRDLFRQPKWMEEVAGSSGAAWRSVPGAPGIPQEELDRGTAALLLPHLLAATTTPGDVLVARWVGFGGELLRERFAPCAVLPTEGRQHVLLRGPLKGVMTGVGRAPWSAERDVVHGIWWPADRAWFVHTEVDGHTTEVAGSRQLLDAMLADPGLDVVEVTHTTDEWDHL